MTEPRLRWPTVLGWSFYDLASNFYAFVVLTAYFPPWFKDKEFGPGGTMLQLGIAQAAAMTAMIVLFPILGVLTDQYRRRVRLVFMFTMLCIIPQAMLGASTSILSVLLLYALARVGYQGAFIFYGSMLPDVAGARSREGRVSGLGTAFGYVGSLLAILSMQYLFRIDETRREMAFPASALLYAAFTIPFFLLARDTAPVDVEWGTYWGRIPQAVRTFFRTLREATRYRAPFLFLLACFFLLDAVESVIVIMGIVMAEVMNLGQREINLFYFLGIGTAAFGSVASGWLADRIGLARTLAGLFLCWVGVFALAAFFLETWMLWVVAPILGVCLGATWTCGRPYLMQLAPAEKRTEFFSLFGVIDRFSVAVGPLVAGIILHFAEEPLGKRMAYQLVIGYFLLSALIGFVILPIKRRTSPDLRASNP